MLEFWSAVSLEPRHLHKDHRPKATANAALNRNQMLMYGIAGNWQLPGSPAGDPPPRWVKSYFQDPYV